MMPPLAAQPRSSQVRLPDRSGSPLDRRQWRAWTDALASPKFSERQAAERRLLDAGPAVLPVLENLDHPDDALAALDRADQGADPTPQSLKLRGSIFMQQKKWPEADAALSKAVAALPNDAESHAWLGHAEMELRQYAPAEQELRRALELDSSNVGPLRDLVGVLYLSGNYNATINAIDLLQQHDTLNALDWFFWAISCDKLGRKQEAADAYQKFLDLDHGQHADQEFQARGRLVVLLPELGKKKK